MILTVLEARVPPAQVAILESEYRALATRPRPDGLIRSYLLRSTTDPLAWRLETLWRDRECLEAMRSQGTPAGLILFRSVGVEPALSILDVRAAIEPE